MHGSLTIGELSARSGVAPSALRYYERLGLIRSERTGGNQRRYARAELRRVAFIRISQQVGVSLEEIREALASLPEARTPSPRPTGRGSPRAGGAGWTSRSGCSSGSATTWTAASAAAACRCSAARSTTPADALAGEGPGARLVLPRPADDPTPAGSPA